MIKENAEKLRARGKELLLANKVWGGIVGIIPGLDWVLQKFVVKKNATKKLGQLFGIDVRFVEDNKKPEKKKDQEKEKEKEKEKENEKKKEKTPLKKAEYITKGIDDEQFTLKGEELIEDTKTEKVGNSVRITGEAGSYIGVAVGQGIMRAASAIGQTTAEGVSTASSIAVGVGATALKVVGASFFVVGAIAGVSVGGYFTHKYCEDLLNKFVEFYKANAKKISNSYLEAEKYFSNITD